MPESTLDELKTERDVLVDEIRRLTRDRESLKATLTIQRTELATILQHADARKKLLEVQASQNGDRSLAIQREQAELAARSETLAQQAADLAKLPKQYEQIRNITNEIEKRVNERKREVEAILTNITADQQRLEASRVETQRLTKGLEEAQAALVTTQKERDALLVLQNESKAQYDRGVDLMSQAKDVQQAARVHELALRDVNDKLIADQYKLRQAQEKFLKEVDGHRVEKERWRQTHTEVADG